MNLTFHNFYGKKTFISKKYVEKLCLNICTNYHTKTIHEKPYKSNRNCLCFTSLEKLLYIKESQRLCQSVVNLAMHLSDDQCIKTSLR